MLNTYMDTITNENIEIRLLLDAILSKYGYDFTNYSKAHIKRRIKHRMSMDHILNISELQHKILFDEKYFLTLLFELSINTTQMFRDPFFYLEIRKKVIPIINTHPFIRIWHAGCSTGEEVYSMAIILKETGLYEKTQMYATDFNEKVINKAKKGIYPISHIPEHTKNYQKAGGKEPFSNYYTAKYDSIIIANNLKKNILFSEHNLSTDSVFNEMHLILCRNVLIYFNKILQKRVIKLFYDSLSIGGILCLGSKETLRFTDYDDCFEEIVKNQKIYRKIK